MSELKYRNVKVVMRTLSYSTV